MNLGVNHGLYFDLGRTTSAPRSQRLFVAEDDRDTREAIVSALVDEGRR